MRAAFCWGLALENIIVNSAHTDTETNLTVIQNKSCLFLWYFTTMMWTVWLSTETRAWPIFHTQGSSDRQEADKSWPTATQGPPAPPSQSCCCSSTPLHLAQPQCSRPTNACRQETPTLNDYNSQPGTKIKRLIRKRGLDERTEWGGWELPQWQSSKGCDQWLRV